MKRFIMLGAMVTLPMIAFAQPMILASSVMDVTDARFDFEHIKTATVTLASDDGSTPSDIVVDYGVGSVFLKINHTSYDDNGCAIFDAGLPSSDDNVDGHRFNIYLESDYGCQNSSTGWKASVREGYGWCGTMDSTMELVGVPVWHSMN